MTLRRAGAARQSETATTFLLLVCCFGLSATILVRAQDRSSFVPYDSTMGHVGVNARLHWILAPGRDFFLVLNHGVEASITDPIAPPAAISNVLVAKLRWEFRP
jgi:hypothetical protein